MLYISLVNNKKMLFYLDFMLSYFKNIKPFTNHISNAGNLINLNARVSFLGYEHRDEITYDWHGMKRGQREFVLWQYTLSGKGKLIYEDQEHDLLPGEAMFVHIPHNHRYFLPKDSDHWDFVFIILRGVEALRICKEAEKINGPLIKYHSESQSLECAENIFKESTQINCDSYKLSGLAYQFCMGLFADIMPQRTEMRPEAIEKAVKYALAHFEEAIGVDEMAERADLSRYHFSRQFKKYMGISPADFIHKLRMDKAVNLLQSDSMPVYAVAEKCGFNSSSYFCSSFVKEFGYSPNAFRNNK
jgi:AraC family transcriptional regulator